MAKAEKTKPAAKQVIAVTGGMNKSAQPFGDDPPAVVVDPDAPPRALLNWAAGQLRVLRVLAAALAEADREAELVDALATLAEQVEAALGAAVARLPK